MKLRPQKLPWKGKVEKLRRIVLSGLAIEELSPEMLTILTTWREHHHGKVSDHDAMRAVEHIGGEPKDPLLWEPYSDERGDEERFFGWRFRATLVGINSQPWWIAMADLDRAGDPTDHQRQMIDKAVDLLGCHDVKRDLIRIIPGNDTGARYTMFWNWFHTGKLLDLHLHPATRDMLIVDEGTPCRPGYERMEKASRKGGPPA